VAGAAEFRATLAWHSPEDVPRERALVQTPLPARLYLAQSEGPNPATRHLSGELAALSRTDLGAALEAVLREITEFATLTEATLEVSVVRGLPPRVASPRALERLARDLWEAGFPVRFAPSWTPSPKADVYLGVGGSAHLFEFVRAHPSWSLA
jgi:hypothetical protein